MKLSDLDFIILHILSNAEISGYVLRKKIGDSIFYAYSSSPGSIYPAMKKLLKHELIEKIDESRSSGYRTTEEGRSRLLIWLKEQIQAEDVQKGFESILLKFNILESIFSSSEKIDFLDQFEKALASEIDRYQEYHSLNSDKLTLHHRLIFEHKIEKYITAINWSSSAKQEIGS